MRKFEFFTKEKMGVYKRIVAGAVTGGLIFCGLSGCSLLTKKSTESNFSYMSESTVDYSGMSKASNAVASAYSEADYGETYEEALADKVGATGSDTANSLIDDGTSISEDSTYEQKLIKTYNYSFQTMDFQASMDFLKESLKQLGGYMESSEISGSSYPSANLVLRVPTSRVDEFLESVGSIGEITYQAVSTEDVSLHYYDISARLESLRAQHDRLIELMERAENLSDIAQLESQLSDVEYNINSYQSQLKLYDNLVDYTTININLSAVRQTVPVEEDTFWTKITKGLVANTADLIILLENLIIALITGLPYILVLAVAALILRAVIRKALKKREERKAGRTAVKPVEKNGEKP